MKSIMWLGSIIRLKHKIQMIYGIDKHSFKVVYHYHDVDLFHLDVLYGEVFMQKIYFHLLVLEASKLVSLKPDYLNLQQFTCFHTLEFENFWYKIIRHVWGQWRYQHNEPYYYGPEFKSIANNDCQIHPIKLESNKTEVLAFCGGGKDSLVGMKLLERANISYSSLAYSQTIYGDSNEQHELINQLVGCNTSEKHHQLTIHDNFVATSILKLYSDSQEILAAETPASLFSALPVVLHNRYRYMVLAHERSANVGNLFWSETNEDINHQWGKSYAAEKLLNNYIQTEFIQNGSYFSILQPIYDTTIFNLLRQDQQLIQTTHSCNIKKPWCYKCSKCAYVWLNYQAYLDTDLLNTMFVENLFDLEENQESFLQMLGLGKHTPFECIGQIAETRLAFELCYSKGLRGKAMDLYKQKFPHLDVQPILDKYLTVNMNQAGIPQTFSLPIELQFNKAVIFGREYILKILKDNL